MTCRDWDAASTSNRPRDGGAFVFPCDNYFIGVFNGFGYKYVHARLLSKPRTSVHMETRVPGITLFFSLLPCFPWWRIQLFCDFVSVLHPPRAACEPEVCVFPLRAVFFLAFLLFVSSIFLVFLPFSDFDLDIVCFILSFSCGYYAVPSVSVSAATRLA